MPTDTATDAMRRRVKSKREKQRNAGEKSQVPASMRELKDAREKVVINDAFVPLLS